MKTFLYTLALVSLSSLSQAQLEGRYTINQQLPTKKTNFNTLTEATNALRFQGVKGAVVFELAAGTYYEPLVLESIDNDVNASVTFTAANQKQVVFSSDGLALLINNSDNIQIENLIFEGQSTEISNLAVISNSNNVTLNLNEFVVSETNLNHKSAISLTGTSSDNIISNNLVKGSSGIEINRLSNGNTISQNNIYFENVGIDISSSINATISANEMKGLHEKGQIGISLDGHVGNLQILSNNISNVANGINQVLTFRPVTEKFNGSIVNNVVFASENAISLSNNIDGLQIAFNSLNVETGVVIDISENQAGSVKNVNLIANNLINFNGNNILLADGKHNFSKIDFNNLYSEAGTFSAWMGQYEINGLDQWKTTVKAKNAISNNPMYVDLGGAQYILAENSPCIDAGPEASTIGVFTDFDGDERINKTEIGADEFNKTAYDNIMQKLQFALNND